MRIQTVGSICLVAAMGCGKGTRGWPQASLGEIDRGRGWGAIGMVIDAQGKPVVAYATASIGFSANQVLVKRWNGSSWEALGGQLNTPSAGATYLDLALLPDGNPVVSWPIWNAAGSTTVYTQRWDPMSSSWVLLPPRGWNSQVNSSIAADAAGAIFLAGGPVPASPADPGAPVLRATDTSWDAVGAPQGGAGSYARFVKMAGAIALVNQQPGGYAVSQYLGGDRWEVIADLGSGGPGGTTCSFAGADRVAYDACPVWGTDIDASGQPVVHLLATSF